MSQPDHNHQSMRFRPVNRTEPGSWKNSFVRAYLSRGLWVLCLAILISTSLKADDPGSNDLFRLEVNDAGEVSNVFLPRISDMESFWAMEDIVNKLIFRDSANYSYFLEEVVPILDPSAARACSSPSSCERRQYIQILQLTEDVFLKALADPLVYDGQGFKVNYKYLGSSGLTTYESYEFISGASRIFKVDREAFEIAKHQFWCEGSLDDLIPSLKAVVTIKGLTSEPFNMEHTSTRCKEIEAQTGLEASGESS